ncbi:DMT family transporter [Chloroflexota bacterium]
MSGSAFALLAAVFFSLNVLATRRAVVKVSSSFLGVFITVFLAVPFFGLILTIMGRLPQAWAFPWQGYLFLAAAGVVHFVIGRSLTFRAVQLVGGNMSSILLRCGPIVAVIWGVSILHETLTWQVACGSLLVILGVGVIAWDPMMAGRRGSTSARVPMKGVLFGLGGSIFFGTSPLLVKLGLGDSGYPVAATFISYLAASAVLGLLLSNRDRRAGLVSMDRHAVLWFCAAGVMVALAQLCRYVALSLSPVSVVSPLESISPLLVIFLSFLFNRKLETFTIKTILGAAATVAGTIVLY